MKFDAKSKDTVQRELTYIRDKTRKCCEKLNVVVNFPENLLEPLPYTKQLDSNDSTTYSEDEEEEEGQFESANSSTRASLTVFPEIFRMIF